MGLAPLHARQAPPLVKLAQLLLGSSRRQVQMGPSYRKAIDSTWQEIRIGKKIHPQLHASFLYWYSVSVFDEIVVLYVVPEFLAGVHSSFTV